MVWRHLTDSFHSIDSPSAQAALGKGIEITNAGGAGFKAWEVVKVGKKYFFSDRFFAQNRPHLDLTGRSRCLCARDPDQEVGHLRSSGNTGRDQQGRSAGALDNKKEFSDRDFQLSFSDHRASYPL